MNNIKKVIPKIVGFGLNTLSRWSPEKAGEIAFDIFCTPRAGRIGEADQFFLSKADGQNELKTPYGFTKVYEWNPDAARSVLLLHGWESNTARWEPLMRSLQAMRHRIIGIDAPAHGASDGNRFNMIKYAEAIHAAVNCYQPDYVIGHSLGAAALSYYLAHYSFSSIHKIVLMGAPSELSIMMQGGFSRSLGLSDRTLTGLFDFFEKQFDRPVAYFSSAEFCKSIDIPALLIHDKNDDVVAADSSMAMHQNLSDSELWLTKGLGHSLQDASVFQKIVTFLHNA